MLSAGPRRLIAAKTVVGSTKRTSLFPARSVVVPSIGPSERGLQLALAAREDDEAQEPCLRRDAQDLGRVDRQSRRGVGRREPGRPGPRSSPVGAARPPRPAWSLSTVTEPVTVKTWASRVALGFWSTR